MKSADGPGCGVDEHEAECLCDVKIGKPVEIMAEWETYRYARELVKGSDTVETLARILRATDLLNSHSAQAPVGSHRDHNRLRFRLYNHVPVERVITDLGLTVGDVVVQVTTSARSNLWKWTIVDLIECQQLINSGEYNIPRITDVFGCEKVICERLFRLFGQPFETKGDFRRKLSKAQQEQVVVWATSGMSQQAVVRECLDVFGIGISRPYVSLLKKKALSDSGV
jgi:hypothetical protein